MPAAAAETEPRPARVAVGLATGQFPAAKRRPRPRWAAGPRRLTLGPRGPAASGPAGGIRALSELDLRYDLNPAGVYQNCPQDAGVYTIEAADGDLLYLAYSRNLPQDVTRHLPENELKIPVIRDKGRYFRYFLTGDPGQVGKVFDAYVQRKGRFPAGMTAAPEGSRWHGKPPPEAPGRLRPQTEPPPAPPAPPEPAGRHIVLVDDDIQLLVLMKELLEVDGHRVYAAANRKMLGEALRLELIEVLILDFHLADLSARQVIEAVRARSPEVLILMITGATQKEEVYELLQAGVRKIFPKPFSMKMLAAAIRDHFK